ncbi:MAG: DUF11 domain-containing protein [Chitinophagaceae bacterium]|nr:DUF11 domain-containing protein [Chitinophagaceae bacterium]
MKNWMSVVFEFCGISGKPGINVVSKAAFILVLFHIQLNIATAQQTGITRIYTDFNGYWTSSSTAISPIRPDNSHNVLGFTWNGQTYSTGVNDAILTAQGVTFTPMRFQAFPVRNITLSGTSALPALGQLKDGVDNGSSVPAPFTQPPNISTFLTDGIQGLDLGTGVANIPTGTLIFDFGGIIDPSQIGDGLPDILVSQIADPSTVLDSVYFTDGSGNLVGNKIAINHMSSTIPAVGRWIADFYNANGTLSGGYTKTERTIRIWAADISAFGINGSNYSPALTLRYKLNGSSDPAFLAFNSNVITVTSANDDIINTPVDAPVHIPVLNNDQPAAALDKSSLQVISGSTHGSTVVNNTTGIITYTPAAGYSGTDHFTYRICNDNATTPQCDDAEVTVNVGNADLSITQSVSNNAPPLSSYITFTITAANNGANNAFGVRIDDALPNGYTFVSANASAGSYNNTTGVWTLGNLNNGSSTVLTITALVNATGVYTNTASISGTLFDPVGGNNTASITPVPVAASGDLQVTKTVDNNTAPAGTNVIFTITATNNGPSNAAGVTVADLLPSGYTYLSSSAAAGTSYNSTTGIWNIGALSTGAGRILTVTAAVNPTGSYINTAEVSSTTADPDLSNNIDTAEVTPAVGTPVFAAGAASARCQAAGTGTYSATASNTTGITYTLLPIEAGSINSTTGEVAWSASFSGNATITAGAEGVNGPSAATHTVTVTAAATTPVFSDDAITVRCQAVGADIINATADHSSGMSYSLAPATAGTINTATGEITWNAAFSGSATITASATGCNGTVTATHTITVNPLPSATILYPGTPFCQAGTATVTITGQTGGMFSAGAGLSINNNTGEIDLANSAAGDYTITYTSDDGNCHNTATATIRVYANPILSVHSPAAVCAPAGVDLTGAAVTAGSSAALTFSYYTDATASIVLNDPTSVVTTGGYYIKGTDGNTCSATAPVTVSIQQLPVTGIAYPNSTYCTYGTATVSINGQTGGSFTSAAGLAIDGASGTINLAASTPGNYTVHYQYSNGACSGSTSTIITIADPVLTITYPNPVCAPSTIDITNNDITAGNGTGISYAYFNDAAGTSVLSNPTAVAVSGTYYIKGAYANGCSSDLQPVQVTIHDQPVIDITAPAGKVCKGAAVTLTASSPGNNVSWQYGEGGSAITVQPYSNTTYTAIATNAEGCSTTVTSNIEVSDFSITLLANRNSVLAGTNVTLQANANESFEVTAWMPQQLFNAQTGTSQTITISDTAKTLYVTGRSAGGCVDTASLKINIEANTSDVFIPNAFTPNGDGRNDVFKVFGSSVQSVEMQIYTQWGNLIFETKDNNAGWNGTHNGKAQPVGMYLYVVRVRLYNNDTIIKKGNVHLLR